MFKHELNYVKVDIEKEVERYLLYGGKYHFRYQMPYRNQSRYQQYEFYKYNNYQNELYNRALHGLDSFDKRDLITMHPERRQRIVKTHQRAQAMIRNLKRRIIIESSNAFIDSCLPLVGDGPFRDLLLNIRETSEQKCSKTIKMPFKELGITKELLIDKMVKQRILPNNFYELTKPQPLKSTHHESRNSNQRRSISHS